MKSKKAAAAFCGSCFFAGKPQQFKLQFAEDLPVEESRINATIKMAKAKESTLRTILNEIDAKQYLLDNAQKYKIPRKEIERTRKQLESYKKQLEEYGRK